MTRPFSLVGPGRAGRSLAGALESLGWSEHARFGRDDDPAGAARDVELCVIATPDAAIEEVAQRIDPGPAVVVHLSGATPVSVLSRFERHGGLHPLVALPEPARGASSLRSCWFGVGGDPQCAELAETLSGRWFSVADEHRPAYHAAATVAANHVTAILGQVERIAELIGAPAGPFLDLAQSSLDATRELGADAALTGPARRGDDATLDAHRQALRTSLPLDAVAYDALVELIISHLAGPA